MGGVKFDVGIHALLTMCILGSICAALRGYGARHVNFYFVLIVTTGMLIFFNLLRGERSNFFGFIIFLGVLYYTLSRSRFKAILIMLLGPAGLIFVLMWANVRWTAVEQGLIPAIFESTSAVWKDIKEGAVMKMDRFPKATWDLLETSYLYERGIRRNGETYLNLIPQRIPSSIAEIIGYERPISEPWVLAEHFRHGGGIFMVAEAYWNFGLGGVIGFAVIMSWICIAIEKFYRRLPPILYYGYYGSVIVSLSTLFVGVQSFVRSLEIAFLATLAGWLLLKVGGFWRLQSFTAKLPTKPQII